MIVSGDGKGGSRLRENEVEIGQASHPGNKMILFEEKGEGKKRGMLTGNDRGFGRDRGQKNAKHETRRREQKERIT